MEGCQLLVGCSVTKMEMEEEAFFDTRQELSPPPASPLLPWSAGGLCSVWERRERFMRSMGLECSGSPKAQSAAGTVGDGAENEMEIVPELGRLWSQSDETDCSLSSWSTESYEEGASDDNSLSGHCSSMDIGGSSKVGRSFSSLSFLQRLMSHSGSKLPSSVPKAIERRRTGWLRRLGLRAGPVDHGGDESCTSSSGSGRFEVERVKVCSYQKRSKELSALYQTQVIKAHDGAILTMRFSPDGQFLASSGEDGVVRVWGVTQSEVCRIPMDDDSCVYLKAHAKCGLVPVNLDSVRKRKNKGMKPSPERTCIVIPTTVFQISDEPLHEFHGHCGDVLDLSWSDNKQLLSASTDKTVRLWEIGSANCITVFAHSDFVTCVQFNPANENRFISGSIDGKIRVWDTSRRSVVDWVDIRDIITAVAYRPDGRGAVIGTITGNCRFYDASDELLRFETQIALNSKKKSSLKRITAFEFCPSNPSKLMITSADSKIKILDGTNVTQNYSGLRSGCCQLLATFTPDGTHIISASEDSNIYVWNHEDEHTWKQAKTISSSEHFHSYNAAIAIPWKGKTARSSVSLASQFLVPQGDALWCTDRASKCNSCRPGEYSSINNFVSKHVAAPVVFNLNQESSLDAICKSAVTWPEEMLPSCSIGDSLDESQHKFLRNFFQRTSSLWGQVIVTAGWDGRIRSFQNYGLPVNH